MHTEFAGLFSFFTRDRGLAGRCPARQNSGSKRGLASTRRRRARRRRAAAGLRPSRDTRPPLRTLRGDSMAIAPTILPDVTADRDRAGELAALDRAHALGMIGEMEYKL